MSNKRPPEISVIIPARLEPFLQKTIEDIFCKASRPIEIIVVLDGHWPNPQLNDNESLIIIHSGNPQGMRKCINDGVNIASGKYILKSDAHCMFDEGFDVKLIKDMQPNWVVIPTRKRLDADTWQLINDGRPDINYMYLKDNRGRIDDKKNSDTSLEKDRIVETTAFQGSCYFIEKQYYKKLGLLDHINFGGSGHEAQEIYYKVKNDGGKIVRNKNTWFAHWHKEKPNFKIDRSKSRLYLDELLKTTEKKGNNIIKTVMKKPARIKDFIIDKYKLGDVYGKEGAVQIPGMGRKGLYHLFAELGYNVGAEVGVQRGRNAKDMFDIIPDLHLYLIDPYRNHPFGYRKWEDKHHAKFLKMTQDRLKNNWVIKQIVDYSENAHKEIPDNSLDFVYIDGDHSYTFVMLDILFYLRKVKRGGIIAGHDYYYSHPRQANIAKVTAAIDDYTKRHKIRPFFITDKFARGMGGKGDECPSWFWAKEGHERNNFEKTNFKKAVIQYTDNTGDPLFMSKCRKQLMKCANENGITDVICVSQKPVLDLGKNIVMDLERSVLSIYKQIYRGLEETEADIIYLCEHDIVYHPSHFEFMPREEGIFYYDWNRWSVCDETGKAVFYYTDVPSMMCAFRTTLLNHYARCIIKVEKEGWSGKDGYSPPKGLPKKDRTGKRQTYISKFPSLDVRRKESWTRKRMTKDQFRGKNSNRGWKESGHVPGWGQTEGRFNEIIDSL